TTDTDIGSEVAWRLTPAGMEQLLMTEDKLDGGKLRELIDDKILGKEHFDWMAIEDKSKASGIAKFLVSLQIFWLLFECMGRNLPGLAPSLLESHTLIRMFPGCPLIITCVILTTLVLEFSYTLLSYFFLVVNNPLTSLFLSSYQLVPPLSL